MKKSITFLVLQISLALLLMSTSALAQNQYIFEFDGVDDLIRYNDDATLDVMNGATDYTIQCWVYPTSTTINNKVVLRRWNQFVLTLYQDANRRFYFTHKDNTGANTFVNSDTNAINIGEWNHLAVVCNSAENRIYLYANGVDVTLTPQTALTLRDNTADDNFYVGYGGTGTYPACFIDEVYVSNVATPQSELRFHPNDLPFMPDANTAVLFHFDEGTGDSTLNSASGTLARLGGADPGDPQQPTWRTWDYPSTSLPLPVEIEANVESPINFSLNQNYPNPFNPSTLIKYSVAQDGFVNVSVFNLIGEKVATLVNDNMKAGSYEVNFNASQLSSGVYIYQLQAGKFVSFKKMVLIK